MKSCQRIDCLIAYILFNIISVMLWQPVHLCIHVLPWSFCSQFLAQYSSEATDILAPNTGETQKDVNNVSCRRDLTEILFNPLPHNTVF